MPILFHETSQTFHLYNEHISYIFKVLKNGHLGQLYYGKHIRDRENFDHLLEMQARSMAVCRFEGDLSFSLEHLKQEYPAYGSGDMRHPAMDIIQENGSRIIDFTYQSYELMNGKPKLLGLPATYVEDESEAATLLVTMYDAVMETELVLSYTIYETLPVICRNARFVHHGHAPISLETAMSMNLDLPDKEYEMIELTGAWSRERSVKERKLEHGIQSIYSMRGNSSNNFNPFIALKRFEATEFNGEVLGFSFVYSGNFLAQVEVDTYDVTRISMGLHPHCFSWSLSQGESFQTPEAVMVYSDQGLNRMSQVYHELYQKRLARGKYRDQVRPILVNNWEGTYFDFDEDKIVSMASTAKKLGIELFVLDDGWFGKRNDDTTGLGDWYPNLNKLPNGIKGLSEKVEALGLKFGLWIEPEMVSHDSDLYRQHPEWTLATPQRPSSHGRNQYILDFSNDEVVDAIYDMLYKVISESSISYIKWDMNRCMSEVYSTAKAAKDQGKVMHQYILGVYRLYEQLTTEFPNILFESCSSGGARFDPGMLYYAPQCWASDDSDAIERLKIQYGTSIVYPISSIGAHVSAIPNHQVYRSTPIETRANVAYFGTFGYELDLNQLDQENLDKIVKQVEFMKEYREVIQFGTFYRLKSPFETKMTAWMVVSKDQNTALVGYYKPLQEVNVAYERLPLCGLALDKEYHVSLLDIDCYGDELMNAGLITSDTPPQSIDEIYDGSHGDYTSRIYIIKAK